MVENRPKGRSQHPPLLAHKKQKDIPNGRCLNEKIAFLKKVLSQNNALYLNQQIHLKNKNIFSNALSVPEDTNGHITQRFR
ncbi:MAG: hypothetical protein KME14_13155 [Tildeniella torsiva UHER 1998/13D]|jgi:hypothetical protein|nr:hypothetical protein [Tildeniella torsiva UHER 1998/13D]